jgi:hypothetical protein
VLNHGACADRHRQSFAERTNGFIHGRVVEDSTRASREEGPIASVTTTTSNSYSCRWATVERTQCECDEPCDGQRYDHIHILEACETFSMTHVLTLKIDSNSKNGDRCSEMEQICTKLEIVSHFDSSQTNIFIERKRHVKKRGGCRKKKSLWKILSAEFFLSCKKLETPDLDF